MRKRIFLPFLAIILVLLVGCRAKVEEPPQGEVSQEALSVAGETIPPTAAPSIAKTRLRPKGKIDRNEEIQIALKNAGFYKGVIDGIIGPKTKRAIREFQKANGLKADGLVGPKTWPILERYLPQ